MIYLSIKYVFSFFVGIFFLLGEVPPKLGLPFGIEYKGFNNLPLWQGKVIIAWTHNSWLDTLFAHFIYFPWWFRETKQDIIGLIKEFFRFFKSFFHWMIDERVEIETHVKKEAFSKDVPIIFADGYNLRHFSFLAPDYIYYVDRRENYEVGRATTYRFAKNSLNSGCRISIFVEGGMENHAKPEDLIYDIKTRKPILKVLQPGVAELVLDTRACLVPVRIIGADRVLPRWKIPIPRLWHKVIITVGEPLIFPLDASKFRVGADLTKSLLDLYYEDMEGRNLQ